LRLIGCRGKKTHKPRSWSLLEKTN
jgi:hypothetical protein